MLKKKFWQRGLLLIFILLILDVCIFAVTPVIPKDSSPVVYSLEPGTPIWKVAFQLEENHLLSRPLYWIAAAELLNKAHQLKAGDYRINPGDRPLTLLEKIASGKVVLYAITIPEGWTFAQMATAINRQPYLKHGTDFSAANLMEKVGAAGRSPEGQFFPDTYLFGRWTPESTIFVTAYKLMQERLQKAWDTRDVSVPYANKDEALIIASLIEKEAAKPNERPLIAGVIINRLQKHMYLQIDASVIYGLGANYHGKLLRSDLKIDTPYNTYLHKGLPPTAICLPGFSAIQAALHPEKTDALFYVARGDGTHQFSATLAQHNEAVNKFIKHNVKE